MMLAPYRSNVLLDTFNGASGLLDCPKPCESLGIDLKRGGSCGFHALLAE